MISVGQTNVKSNGYEKRTSHFPLYCDNSISANSRLGKTAWPLKHGAGLPMRATQHGHGPPKWHGQFGGQWQSGPHGHGGCGPGGHPQHPGGGGGLLILM